MYNKTVILPIIAVIALIVEMVFGIKISVDVQDQVAVAIGNVVAVVTLIYGIFKNHKSEV